MKRTFGLLRERIKNKFKNNGEFASVLGMNKSTLSKKLCGEADFTHNEIVSICDLLDIPADKIGLYFFY